MIINNINEDIDAVNAQRKFRRSIKSKQQTRYAHNWWKSAMILLTKISNLSGMEIQEGVLTELNMNHNIANFTGLLIRAIDSHAPSKVRREYAKTLPSIVHATGLKYRTPNKEEIQRHQDTVGASSRPVKYVFYFKNPEQARDILLVNFPDLLCLFTEIDRRF